MDVQRQGSDSGDSESDELQSRSLRRRSPSLRAAASLGSCRRGLAAARDSVTPAVGGQISLSPKSPCCNGARLSPSPHAVRIPRGHCRVRRQPRPRECFLLRVRWLHWERRVVPLVPGRERDTGVQVSRVDCVHVRGICLEAPRLSSTVRSDFRVAVVYTPSRVPVTVVLGDLAVVITRASSVPGAAASVLEEGRRLLRREVLRFRSGRPR